MQVDYSFARRFSCGLLVACALLLAVSTPTSAQQAPPTLGQETKGEPAVDETATGDLGDAEKNRRGQLDVDQSEEDQRGINSVLGKAEIKESRRENGQLYLIELEHSSGAKQYIEETDSDGKIESTSNDIEETPNLPKWKLGSW